jgi:hypothetical protein
LVPYFNNMVATTKCRNSKHLLTVTTRNEMLSRGCGNYTDGWICDDCNSDHTTSYSMSQPFMRCDICSLDYCMTCKDKFPQGSFVVAHQVVNDYGL